MERKIAQIQSSNMQLSPKSPSSKNVETTKFSLLMHLNHWLKRKFESPSPTYIQNQNIPCFPTHSSKISTKTLPSHSFSKNRINFLIQSLYPVAPSPQPRPKSGTPYHCLVLYLSSSFFPWLFSPITESWNSLFIFPKNLFFSPLVFLDNIHLKVMSF